MDKPEGTLEIHIARPKKFSKQYTLGLRGARSTIVTVPQTFLVVNELRAGDKIYAYMMGDDLLISKHKYG